MRKLVAVLALALLAGCAAIQTATQPVDLVTLQKSAYAARATYVGSLRVMAELVVLPRCERSPPPCIRQAVVDEMRKVELRADAVTGAAEDAARSMTINPTMVELAINAATAFQSITNANRTR